MAGVIVELIYVESYRREIWDDDVPSRPGWTLRCSVHGLLGSPPGYAYAKRRHAQTEATRHERKYHGAAS